MNETLQERKSSMQSGAAAVSAAVFLIALLLRLAGSPGIPPFDDLYHLERMAAFPHIVEFDPDRGERGAFCPWPPLYDFLLGLVQRLFGGVTWTPPLFFAAFAAGLTFAMRRFGLLAASTAGLAVAASPFLIGVSELGHIDHHYVEPLLVLLILGATVRRNGIALGIAVAVALLVQPALFVAAGLAFVALFVAGQSRQGARAFAIAAAAVVVYRLTREAGYPDSAWFLGWPHAALLTGAAVACALRPSPGPLPPSRGEGARVAIALAAGVAVALSIPSTATAFLTGLHFFGGDPWLSSIIEFQPLFRHASEIGTDLANLTGGALLGLFLWRKQKTVAFFSTAYLLLAVSSRRFLVPAIALFAISGALAAAWAHRRTLAIAAAAFTLLPPIVYDLYQAGAVEPWHEEFRIMGERMRPLPQGRVLGPWSFGHAIHVIGHKPVLIDNFGSMPDEDAFTRSVEMMLTTHESKLLRHCRYARVRYLILPHPAYIPATAATIGIPRELYARTRLARRTVWSRLYNGERIAGFTRVSDGPIEIWQID